MFGIPVLFQVVVVVRRVPRHIGIPILFQGLLLMDSYPSLEAFFEGFLSFFKLVCKDSCPFVTPFLGGSYP